MSGFDIRREDGVPFVRFLHSNTQMPLMGYARRCQSEFASPFRMMSTLWAAEAIRVAAYFGIDAKTRVHAIRVAAPAASLNDLRSRIASELRARSLNRWEEAFWDRFEMEGPPPSGGSVTRRGVGRGYISQAGGRLPSL